ncbi:MAG: hypothetical protein QM802_04140 [Agriterribacter sp.]
MLRVMITVMLSISTFICLSQESKTACNILKKGKFKYLDAHDTTAYIIMNGDIQTEYSNNNADTIESKIKWLTACSYEMTMTRITKPNFPFKPGDVMNVTIDKIDEDIIYYSATVNESSFQGRFKKLPY